MNRAKKFGVPLSVVISFTGAVPVKLGPEQMRAPNKKKVLTDLLCWMLTSGTEKVLRDERCVLVAGSW